MTQQELNEILRKHKLWLDGKEGGERANMQSAHMRSANMQSANMQSAHMRSADMQCANMQRADMQCADMRYADMQCADMRYADMRYANLRNANMQRANIDYSAWPLWCGSLKAHVDDRIAIQLLYHTLSVVQNSPYVSEELKRTLLTEPVVDIANRFHRVDECGALEVYEGESHDEQ